MLSLIPRLGKTGAGKLLTHRGPPSVHIASRPLYFLAGGALRREPYKEHAQLQFHTARSNLVSVLLFVQIDILQVRYSLAG